MLGIPFTKETAREYGLKSARVRAERQRKLEDEASALRQIQEHRRLTELEAVPGWLRVVVERVRSVADGVLGRMEKTATEGDKMDAAELDKLASALDKLLTIERVTTMRPAPAPVRAKSQRPRTSLESLPDPTPIEPSN